MLLALPFILLIATAVAMLVIYTVQPKFAFHWLIAAGGTLLTWLSVLILHSFLPLSLSFPAWLPQSVFPESPVLLLDEISWAFTFASSTLLLSAILTTVTRSTETEYSRRTWAGLVSSIILTAVSLVSVTVGNLLALLLTWAGLDLVELSLGLYQKSSQATHSKTIIVFAARSASQLFILLAIISAEASGLSTSLNQLNAHITPFIFLATGIRLGVLPLFPYKRENEENPSNFQTLSNLIPLAPALMLVSRAAATSTPLAGLSWFLLLVGLTGLYGSIIWYSHPEEFNAGSGWITSIGALTLASGLRLQPTASLAWGIALLFGGGLQFLSEVQIRFLMPALLVGVFFLTNLPGTPSWFAVHLYAPPLQLMLFFYLISQSLLLAGSLQNAIRTNRNSARLERWVWALYNWGMALLILGWVLVAWWTGLIRGAPGLPRPSLVESWPALVSILLATFLFWSRLWRWPVFERISDGLSFIFSLIWLYRLAGLGSVFLRRVLSLASTLLESQAGIIWAFLLLVLLLSLFSQIGQGG